MRSPSALRIGLCARSALLLSLCLGRSLAHSALVLQTPRAPSAEAASEDPGGSRAATRERSLNASPWSAAGTDSEGESAGSAPQENIIVRGFVLRQTLQWGARLRTVKGNEDMYRSHLNLGEGLKLFHSSFDLSAPESRGRLFDHLQVNLNNWGGDPYNTADVYLKKNLFYVFRYRYQKIDYFTSIPDFANPLLARGLLSDQHRYDTTRRFSQARLDLFPDAPRFQLHLGYARNTAWGPAFTTVNLGGDEFLLARQVKNSANDYVIGADVRWGWLRISVEQAFRTFKDDPGYILPGNFSVGNDPDPIFGFQQLFLTDFGRSVRLRSTLPATRLAVTSYRVPRIAFTVRVSYSKASVVHTLAQEFQGVVLNRETAIFASDGLALARAGPSKPFTVGDGSVRLSLTRRLHLTTRFRGTHFTIAGSRDLVERFSNLDDPQTPVTRQEHSFRHLSVTSLANHWEADFALTPRMSVRAGHRVEHRRTRVQAQDEGRDSISGPGFPSLFRTRREETRQTAQTLLAGFTYRRSRVLRIALDYENGGSLTEFSGVGPRDEQRGRLRVQLAPSEKWHVTFSAAVSDVLRPSRALALDYIFLNQNRNRQGGISFSWSPQERFTLDADYTRGHVTAQIHTLDLRARDVPVPPLLYLEKSRILHSGLTAILLRDLHLSLGYRLVHLRGSLPLSFHRPYARVQVPVHKRIQAHVEYDYSGYGERECPASSSLTLICRRGISPSALGYRAHLFTVGMRVTF